MAKPPPYTDEQRTIFEVYLKRFSGNVKMAANRCCIDAGTATVWAAQLKRQEEQEEADEEEADEDAPAEMSPSPEGRKCPMPPAHLVDEDDENQAIYWVPDPAASEWLMNTFVKEDGPLYCEEFWHLTLAYVGVLWTNEKHPRACGQAMLPKTQGDVWAKSRFTFQLRQWFGEVPDFIITLDARYWQQACDRERCSTMEHELRHCEVKTNPFGEPTFTEEGKPVGRMAPHPVEEFPECVERYGAEAGAGQTFALVKAANRRPSITDEMIEVACGPW